MNSFTRFPLFALLLVTPTLLASAACTQSKCEDVSLCTAPRDAGMPPFDAVFDSGLYADLGSDAGTDVDAGTEVDAGTASDGGSILPDYDAGDPFGDAGTLGTPGWVPLDVRVDGTMCTPLVACGGDEVGTWDVTGGCVDFPVPAALGRCPGATITASGRARGRVAFDGTIARRTAQSEVSAEVFIPSLCAGFAGGCPAIQTLIAMSLPDPVCVATAAGDCRCAARQTNVIDDGDAYTTMSNQIVSTTSGKRWDYCVTAGQLRYRDVSTTGSVEPGIIELGLR